MTTRARAAAVAAAVLLVPLLVFVLAMAVDSIRKSRDRAADLNRDQTSVCLDESGAKYSQGALLRLKDGRVVKCHHGRWVDPAKLE
jgi:hypothetical protein